MALDWIKLLCHDRRGKSAGPSTSSIPEDVSDHRTPSERDHDRILFSTPVRRLADKTQVFPLERNDSVRNRLTHSIEVANLARSLGTALVYGEGPLSQIGNSARNIPTILAAIGLAHDLGNPPFGHQGENAIRSWFLEHFRDSKPDLSGWTEAMKQDFLQFEGNAQTIRLVTRLQFHQSDLGLNLTHGTLASLIKYPSPSDKIKPKLSQVRKKFGYFQSEAPIICEIWNATGLDEGVRHPLTFIMEACDDIAYSVLDVEDAIKKRIVSVPDLLSHLELCAKKAEQYPERSNLIRHVIELARKRYEDYQSQKLTPSELNNISMELFRVYAIREMINSVYSKFRKELPTIMEGGWDKELITESDAGALCEGLKTFAQKNAYSNRSVLEIELQGYYVLRGLMDIFWSAIERCATDEEKRAKQDPLNEYVFSRISDSYKRVFGKSSKTLPLRYRQYQLLTDMVAGMTDSYAVELYEDLRSRHGKPARQE